MKNCRKGHTVYAATHSCQRKRNSTDSGTRESRIGSQFSRFIHSCIPMEDEQNRSDSDHYNSYKTYKLDIAFSI